MLRVLTHECWPLVVALALSCPVTMWGQARGSGNGIAREVGHEIATLPFYKLFDHLTFRVDGGTVTLMGQVTKVALKSDAEKAVAHIAGVQHVNNEIEILPPSKVTTSSGWKSIRPSMEMLF